MRKWIGSAAVSLGALALVAGAPAAPSLEGEPTLEASSLEAPVPDVLTPVPEPTTLLMVGAGLAGLAFFGRRREV